MSGMGDEWVGIHWILIIAQYDLVLILMLDGA
jgi:hypothetical protein